MKHFILLAFFVGGTSIMARATPPVVIAHRGASGYLPEHTLEAVALAQGMHADFIEQDIVLSKDDIPIVLHDIHVDTVSDVATRFPDRKRDDGRYYAIDFTLAELKQLRVTERFNAKTGKQVFANRFPKDVGHFQIPTLEEELQLLQGLNRSRGLRAGIYPEIKQPAWHLREGHDISRIVLPILQKYGYVTKEDACWLQCFELDEVQRIRNELRWQGRLVLLIGSFNKGTQDVSEPAFNTYQGLAELAKIVDGIGPAIGLVISGKTPQDRKITDLVSLAHSNKLVVHPYTLRIDELPSTVASADDLMELLFKEAKVDGLFSDFPDLTVEWIKQNH